MFDIGFSELLIIALIGLIVIGPKRLPEVARTVGQWVARIRRFVADVKQDIDREMQQADLNELRNLKQELDETRLAVERTSTDLIKEANIASPPQMTGVSPTVPSPTPPTPSAEPEPPAESKADSPKPSPRRKPRATKRTKKAGDVPARP